LNEVRLFRRRARGIPSSRRHDAAPASEGIIESRAADQSFREAYAGEGTSGGVNRRLRTSLQLVFQDARTQFADAVPPQRPDLRVALRQICGDARRSGMRAEQLLVLVKDVWSAMHSAFASVPSVHGDERLNYVISTCVDEYYSAHVAPPSEATIAGDHEASP
jgi:hypothetical protein